MFTVNADIPAVRATGITERPWAVALTGLVSLALAMSLGRFAYTPLLPMMLHDGSVTLVQGGALATMNYVGYLLGALLCLCIRPDPARMVRLALVLTVLLTLAMAIPSGMLLWALWRMAAGVCSALVMVYTTAWSQQRLVELGRPTLAGMMFCGPGFGIVLTSVPAIGMVAAQWPASWGWTAFTLLGVAMLVPIWGVLGSPSPTQQATEQVPFASSQHKSPKLNVEAWALTLTYGLAGFGYIITATFLPVIARVALPSSVWVDMFWPTFGVGVAVGAWLVTRVGLHYDNRSILVFLYATQAAGVATAAVWPTVAGLALSSLLVGLPFTAIVSVAMREARRLWGSDAAKLIGLMTAAYAVGQIAGPPFATALVERTGGFGASLVVGALALLAGSLACLVMWIVLPGKGQVRI